MRSAGYSLFCGRDEDSTVGDVAVELEFEGHGVLVGSVLEELVDVIPLLLQLGGDSLLEGDLLVALDLGLEIFDLFLLSLDRCVEVVYLLLLLFELRFKFGSICLL